MQKDNVLEINFKKRSLNSETLKGIKKYCF